jgi:hypothetical protein
MIHSTVTFSNQDSAHLHLSLSNIIFVAVVVILVVYMEAGSNTSTVVLRVVGGKENGTQCLGV